MGFEETNICKSRTNCYSCRNNESFRQQMENQYGKIECPEGYPIGAKLEVLPEVAQRAYKKMQEIQKIRNERVEEANSILDELHIIVPEEGKRLVNKLKVLLSPHNKNPERCAYGGDKIGEVDEKCCGGKINKKPAFECKKHVITTEEKCVGCDDFKDK